MFIAENDFNPLHLEMPKEDVYALHNLITRSFGKFFVNSSYCIEVGSWVGNSALIFSRYFNRVYCVDTFDGRTASEWCPDTFSPSKIFDTFISNVGDSIYDQIIPVPHESTFAAKIIPFKVPFIFIDADHSYGAVAADIAAWRGHVSPGGIMAFHDFEWHPGVTDAVNDIFPDRIKTGFSIAHVRL